MPSEISSSMASIWRFVSASHRRAHLLPVSSSRPETPSPLPRPGYIAANGRPGHPRDVVSHACIDFYDAASGRPFDSQFLPELGAARQDIRAPARVGRRRDAGRWRGWRGYRANNYSLALAISSRVEPLSSFSPGPAHQLSLSLYALYPSRHHLAAKVRAFIDFCVEMIASRRS